MTDEIKYTDEQAYHINHSSTFPYLTYRHPLAMKLLMQKINKYNKKARKWGYETRVAYNIKGGYAVPSPLLVYKYDYAGRFWKNFKNGYCNKYLEDLADQIIMESTDLNVKMPLLKRYWRFVYFWLNYP